MRSWFPGRRFQIFIATVWAGVLWTTGYLTAPTLFAVLQDRSLAGSIAGILFSRVAYLGMVAAALLLISQSLALGRAFLRERLTRVTLIMVTLVLIGHFGVQPQIAALRQLGATGTTAFVAWHGIASLLYLAQSLLAIVLIFAAARPR